MLSQLSSALKWQVRHVDSITGWLTLQPQESLVWKRADIPEYILNSSSLIRWLCESLSSKLPEETMLDESESWTSYRNEDELEFHPILYAPYTGKGNLIPVLCGTA